MTSDEDIAKAIEGLRIEKARIALTDEMGRRVGMAEYMARSYLTREQRAARREQRPVDMTRVAWAISEAAKEEES